MADAIDLEPDNLVPQLYSALQAKDAVPLRDLLRTANRVSLAELKEQISPAAQSALTTLHGYCARWDSGEASPPGEAVDRPPADYEPNPIIRFERERKDPHAYHPMIEFERQWRYRTSQSAYPVLPTAPPPAWDARCVEELRGTLRGALRLLMGADATRHGAEYRIATGPAHRGDARDSRSNHKEQRGSQGRPSAQAIDAAAKRCLDDALAAASDAHQSYVPDRASIAKAVSKALNYKIGIASLFANKQTGNERVPRYPAFRAFWKQIQDGSRDARRSRMTKQKP